MSQFVAVALVGLIESFLLSYFLPRIIMASPMVSQFGVIRPSVGSRLLYLVLVPLLLAAGLWQGARQLARFEVPSAVLLTVTVSLTAVLTGLLLSPRLTRWPGMGQWVVPATSMITATAVGLGGLLLVRGGSPGWVLAPLAGLLIVVGNAVARSVVPGWAAARIRARLGRVLGTFDGDLYGLDPARWRLAELDGDDAHLTLMYQLRTPQPAPVRVVMCGFEATDQFIDLPFLGPPPETLPALVGEVMDNSSVDGQPSVKARSGARTTLIVTAIPPIPPGLSVTELLEPVRPVTAEELFSQLPRR